MASALAPPPSVSAPDRPVQLPAGLARTGLIVAAHVPLLLAFGIGLWARPQYQCFPVVAAGAVWLAWERLRAAPRRGGSVGGRTAGLAATWVLLAIASWLWSPWLAAIAFLVALAALAVSTGGWPYLRAVLPAFVLVSLLFPPPLGLDQRLVNRLQSLATRASSVLLDRLAVSHLRQGVIMDVPGQRLVIEEACSGMQSLVALAACTLFYGFWRKRGALHLLALLSAGVVFVLFANVLRITLVVVASVRWDLDLLADSAHEATGIGLFVLVLLLVASADQFLVALGGLRRRKASKTVAPVVVPSARFVPPAASLPGWPAAAAFAPLLALQLYVGASDPGSLALSAPHVEPLPRLELPQQLAGWQQRPEGAKFQVKSVSTAHHADHWFFERGSMQVVVSLFYPFGGWHDATDCYVGMGWTLGQRQVLPGKGGLGPFEACGFSKPSLDQGYCCFGFLSDDGTWESPPEKLTLGEMIATRFSPAGRPKGQRVLYQVQLFSSSLTPMGPAQTEQMHELYREVQNALTPLLRAKARKTS